MLAAVGALRSCARLRGTLVVRSAKCFSEGSTRNAVCELRSTAAKWLRSPFSARIFLKATRLSALSFSFALPLLKKCCCQEITNGVLSRRAEYLSRKTPGSPEPVLTAQDVWQLLKPYLGWFVAAVISAIVVAVLNIQLPILLGELVNVMAEFLQKQSTTGDADLQPLKPIAVKLVLAYGVQAVMTCLYITFLSIMGERMATDLRVKLFTSLLSQDMGFYDVQRTGELNTRLCDDVQEFKSCFKLCVAQGLRTLVQVGGCVVSMFFISPKMTMYTMTALPMVIIVGSMFGAILRVMSRSAQAQNGIAAAVADEAFGNIRTVRAFAMEEQEIGLFRREVDYARTLSEYLGIGIGVFQGATNLFLNGVVLGVLYFGASLISLKELDAGGLMSFLVTAQTMQRSLGQLSIVFGQAVKGYTAGARVFEFIHLVPSIPLKGGWRMPPYVPLSGEICFEDVWFAYPSRPHLVFEGLNLRVKPGKVTALCGPSGEGKTTITALLERFYEPLRGRITLDEMDLRKLDPSWLRGSVVGLISQEPVLFATSIEENIRYGRPNASDEEVHRAARLANADGFIRDFPDGYATLVGERGVTLSGGQKQRVAIARALLKDPPILILDEATSALDSENERLVQEALNRAMSGRTVIVIAQRLDTIKAADCIAVVKDRKVVEKGNHDKLMKKRGVYYEMVNSQNRPR